MATRKSIKVDLGAQQALLERQLKSGHYQDASEVLRNALRALDERDAAYDAYLRARVTASLASKKPRVAAVDVFQNLEERHARELKVSKRGA